MLKILELVGMELNWVQPDAFKMEYELRLGEEVAGRLHFRSSFGSLAIAECAEGCWTFKRMGFFKPRVTIRPCNTETELATFHPNTWTSGGTLLLPDGRQYPASTNFWMTRFDFKSESGQELFVYQKIGGFFHASSSVEIKPEALSIPETPWMVLLGWYLTLLHQQDAAAVTAAT